MFKNPEQAREVDTLDHALCEAEIMLQGLDAFDRRQSVLERRGADHPMSASMMKLLIHELQQEIDELGVRALGLDALRDKPRLLGELGRASSRERVGRFGQASVVDG